MNVWSLQHQRRNRIYGGYFELDLLFDPTLVFESFALYKLSKVGKQLCIYSFLKERGLPENSGKTSLH